MIELDWWWLLLIVAPQIIDGVVWVGARLERVPGAVKGWVVKDD